MDAPPRFTPMLAVLGDLPTETGRWAYEFKWDGVRCLATCHRGRLRLESRRGLDTTATYPELDGLARAVGRDAVLDGEIVALDPAGRPSFSLLQQRLGVRAAGVPGRAARIPAVYLLFDVLWLDGRSTVELPYEERRGLLEGLGLSDARWQTPPVRSGDGDGPVMLDAARQLGLEGVVAKKLGSRYEVGRRSRCWVKSKLLRSEEFVVGAWMPGEGARSGRIGSLLIGQYDVGPDEAVATGRAQQLVYRGGVGTGFSVAELARLEALLAPLRRDTSPFDLGVPRKGARWVEPEVVVGVDYGELTPDGIVRHPRYKGQRDDKAAREVVPDAGR